MAGVRQGRIWPVARPRHFEGPTSWVSQNWFDARRRSGAVRLAARRLRLPDGVGFPYAHAYGCTARRSLPAMLTCKGLIA